MRTQHQAPLTTLASPLTNSPSREALKGRGLMKPWNASLRIGGCDDDEDADDHRREIFDLAVPIGIWRRGRGFALVRTGQQRNKKPLYHVDDAFQRIGIQRDKSGPVIGGETIQPEDERPTAMLPVASF